MSPRRQLAELRADRDIYVRFLTDFGAGRPAPVGETFRDGVLGTISRLQGVVADLDRQIANLETGAAA